MYLHNLFTDKYTLRLILVKSLGHTDLINVNVYTQQTHDVKVKSNWRLCGVITLHRRHVPTGYFQEE